MSESQLQQKFKRKKSKTLKVKRIKSQMQKVKCKIVKKARSQKYESKMSESQLQQKFKRKKVKDTESQKDKKSNTTSHK